MHFTHHGLGSEMSHGIGHFRYNKIQLETKVYRTQTKENKMACLLISFVYVLWASVSRWILISRKWPINFLSKASVSQLVKEKAEGPVRDALSTCSSRDHPEKWKTFKI